MSPRRAAPQKKQDGLPTWVIVVGIGVVVILGVIGLQMVQSPPAAAPVTGNSISAPGRTIGNTNSKVAFVEFSDFQ